MRLIGRIPWRGATCHQAFSRAIRSFHRKSLVRFRWNTLYIMCVLPYPRSCGARLRRKWVGEDLIRSYGALKCLLENRVVVRDFYRKPVQSRLRRISFHCAGSFRSVSFISLSRCALSLNYVTIVSRHKARSRCGTVPNVKKEHLMYGSITEKKKEAAWVPVRVNLAYSVVFTHGLLCTVLVFY